MGVKLDWQIESERVHQRTGEDPIARRQRRHRRFWAVATVALGAASISAIFLMIALRLNAVDNLLRQELTDTVQAEITALRIGDLASFLSIQRSSGETWIPVQSATFNEYQRLKTDGVLRLTGVVTDVTIDGQRGRVLIEEIFNEVPHRTVWYYWRYVDGWRHVPSDYTFWGDPQTVTGQVSTVRFRALDAALGAAIAARVDRWWADGCRVLGCAGGATDDARLTVEIVADPVGQIGWDVSRPDARPDTLIVPSPLATSDRAPLAPDITLELEDRIAILLAERLFDRATNALRPDDISDALWLRQVIIGWLASRFTGRMDLNRLGFVQSLRDSYGDAAVAAITRRLQPSSNIDVVGAALGLPTESLAVDWRTFFQWRLDVEKQLLANGNLAAVETLWDVGDPTARQLMMQRMASPTAPTGQVQAANIALGPNGVPTATVQVTIDGAPFLLTFRLVEGSWKRAA